MANNGRWITIKGNHVLIKDGQTVEEALSERFGDKSQRKSKKRINGGKFEYSEDDGQTWEEMDRDSYDEYEAEDDIFDENNDDDFGFDEDNTLLEDTNQDKISEAIFDNFSLDKVVNDDEYVDIRNFVMDEFNLNGDEANKVVDEFLQNSGIKYEEDEDDLNDVENGTFTAYGHAGLEEIRDAKKRNYYIDVVKHDSAGDPRYTITIDKTRNFDGSPKQESNKKESENNENNNDNLNPDNPKYKGFDRSHITNAKEVDEGYTYTDANGKQVKESIIEYIPYGALQDGDNTKLYGVVRNYDGSDAPKIGASVSASLESAKEDLENSVKLGIQGSDRYLGRGKYDEEFFNIMRDYADDNDPEDVKSRQQYSQKYGWDFNKPFKEHDFMKDDPYEKWKSEREAAKNNEKTQQNFTNRVGKFIDSDGSDQELDAMINDLRKNMSDEDIIKKLAMMFKGTIK